MRQDGCPMDERPTDLASGSRNYIQSNLLNLPLSHYREKKSLSATGTISRQGRRARGKRGKFANMQMRRSTVVSVKSSVPFTIQWSEQ